MNQEESVFEGELTDIEKQKINSKYQQIQNRCIQYNDGNGDYCLRLQEKDLKIHRNPAANRYGHTVNLSDFGIAYGAENEELPCKYDKQVMVHTCGNPVKTKKGKSRCINGLHIQLGNIQYNISQKPCHDYIRKFERKNRFNKSIQTIGTLTVASINAIKSKNKLKHEPLHRCPHLKYPCFIIYCSG